MLFVIIEIVCVSTGTSSALEKKNTGKESQYMVSRPGLGSDPPIGSDRESGCYRYADGWKGTLKSYLISESPIPDIAFKGGMILLDRLSYLLEFGY